MNRAAVAVTASLIALMALTAGACSSDDGNDAGASESTALATESAGETLTNEDGWPRVEDMRDDRYCEVLLLRIIEGRLNAEVWNSYQLNECPQSEWDALDPAAIKEQHASTNVILVLLNGPRYWTMDAVEKNPGTDERRETTFGALDMFLGATVDLGPPPPNMAPYTERVVARDTAFEYDEGADVYEIVYADGRTFIMQSYSLQNDATLTAADLPTLGDRLQLPAGATYRVRTLSETLRVLTPTGDATVIQDELNNTYQLIED